MKFNDEIDIDDRDLQNIIKRVNLICQKAYDCNVPILIDAEESWIQNTIDFIALEMMKIYNKKKVIVYNTIQFYRKDRIEYLNNLITTQKDYKLGIKLVRGAYQNKKLKEQKE